MEIALLHNLLSPAQRLCAQCESSGCYILLCVCTPINVYEFNCILDRSGVESVSKRIGFVGLRDWNGTQRRGEGKGQIW